MTIDVKLAVQNALNLDHAVKAINQALEMNSTLEDAVNDAVKDLLAGTIEECISQKVEEEVENHVQNFDYWTFTDEKLDEFIEI
tara:strand:- start:1930 stop:2181 length:252 start_codon:yes stop_codon:yes gene_type:complete